MTGRTAAIPLVAVSLVLGAIGCAHHSAPPADAAPASAHFDFTLKDLTGADVSLSRFKGHPTLINFWSTTCGPCMAEIPDLVDVANAYRDRGLLVVGISIDDTAAELRDFLTQHKVPYQILLGAGHDDLLDAYDAADAIPVTWFVRTDGTVADKRLGRASRAYFDDHVRALF